MSFSGETELVQAASGTLAAAEEALLRDLIRFARQRFEAAVTACGRLASPVESGAAAALQEEVHAFLRDGWDLLDCLGRQVNICAYRLFPDAGLYPPARMTRQCAFYTVRRALHSHPTAARHPLTTLLWEGTRVLSGGPYARLSFLRNLALFVPVPLPEGRRLPGTSDLPPHLRVLIRRQELASVPLAEGTREMLEWLRGFVELCYAAMARALAEGPSR